MTLNDTTHSGERSAARRDTSSAVGGPDWVQPGMFQPEHLQIDVRVLWDVGAARCRYQIEVRQPTTGELIAMRSRPFHDGLTGSGALTFACEWVRQTLDELVGPF